MSKDSNKNPIIHSVHLGTWFQRTSLHLQEVYAFVSDGKTSGIKTHINRGSFFKGSPLHSALNRDPDTIFDFLEFTFENTSITITEDGIVVLSASYDGDIQSVYDSIKNVYVNHLSPLFSKLFKSGAPLPKELGQIKKIYPFIIIGSNFDEQYCKTLLNKYNDDVISITRTDYV